MAGRWTAGAALAAALLCAARSAAADDAQQAGIDVTCSVAVVAGQTEVQVTVANPNDFEVVYQFRAVAHAGTQTRTIAPTPARIDERATRVRSFRPFPQGRRIDRCEVVAVAPTAPTGRPATAPPPSSKWDLAFENLLLFGRGNGATFKVALHLAIERQAGASWLLGPSAYLALIPDAVEGGVLFHTRHRLKPGVALRLSAGPTVVGSKYAHQFAAVARVGLDFHDSFGFAAEARVRLYEPTDGTPRFPNTILAGVVGRGKGALVLTFVEAIVAAVGFSLAASSL